MAGVDEDMLHAAFLVDHRACGMEAVSRGVKLAFASQQTALPPPPASLPGVWFDAPQPKFHAATLAADDLKSFGQGVERKIDSVHVAGIFEVSLDDCRFLPRRPGHLLVSADMGLIASHEQKLAVVQQYRWLILPKSSRMFLNIPGSAAVAGTEGDELLAVLVIRVHFAEPVAEDQQAMLRVIQDARPQIDDLMRKRVIAECLGEMSTCPAFVIREENAVVVDGDDRRPIPRREPCRR